MRTLRALSAFAIGTVLIAVLRLDAQQPLPPLRVSGNMTTIELSPVLLAANGIYPGPITVINGGIPNIMSGEVDAGTNAETQLLRQSVDDPSLRVIFTVSESFYRIVARRSAGISKVSDLKGKRITTPRNTSAHWFLEKMLRTAKLTEADVTIVPITPVTDMSKALKDGRVDAIAMWEPEAQLAIAITHGKMLAYLGNKEKAAASPIIKASADKALALDPKNDTAWYILGRWHRALADIGSVKRWKTDE